MMAVMVLAAVGPALLFLWLVLRQDRFPEPAAPVLTTFVLGFAIIPVVILLAWPLDTWAARVNNPVWTPVMEAFLTAAVPEEVLKFAVLTLYCLRHRHFNEPMDAIVYGVTASLGFAALENVLYVTQAGDDWTATAIARALTAVPGHGALGAVMGLLLAKARFGPPERRWPLAWALVVPILLHGLYDAPLLWAERVRAAGGELTDNQGLMMGAAVFAVLFVEVAWAWRALRRLRAGQQDWIEAAHRAAPVFEDWATEKRDRDR